jgi:hypothetical protein
MQSDALVSALFTTFATFTAFGAAIAGFVAAGVVVQTLASWWAQHGKTEVLKESVDTAAGYNAPKWIRKKLKDAAKRSPRTIVIAGVFIGLVVLISGVGLMFSFAWLDAYSHGSVAEMKWAYFWVILLFWLEAGLLTLATLLAVAAATGSALNASNLADRSSELDDAVKALDNAVRAAAIANLGP